MVYEQTQKRGHLTDLERAAVRMSVGALPTVEQRVIKERFWEQLSLNEIAFRLCKSLRETKRILASAIQNVRYTLELMFGFCFD